MAPKRAAAASAGGPSKKAAKGSKDAAKPASGSEDSTAPPASYAAPQLVNPQRIQHLKAGEPGAGPVVYWMSRDQRMADNWALLHAAQVAKSKGSHVAVAFNLVGARYSLPAACCRLFHGKSDSRKPVAAAGARVSWCRGTPLRLYAARAEGAADEAAGSWHPVLPSARECAPCRQAPRASACAWPEGPFFFPRCLSRATLQTRFPSWCQIWVLACWSLTTHHFGWADNGGARWVRCRGRWHSHPSQVTYSTWRVHASLLVAKLFGVLVRRLLPGCHQALPSMRWMHTTWFPCGWPLTSARCVERLPRSAGQAPWCCRFRGSKGERRNYVDGLSRTTFPSFALMLFAVCFDAVCSQIGARTLRPKIHKHLPEFLTEFPGLPEGLAPWPSSLPKPEPIDWDALITEVLQR